jgi:hypothetical protein
MDDIICELHREFMTHHRWLYKNARSTLEELHLRFLVSILVPRAYDFGHERYVAMLETQLGVRMSKKCKCCGRRHTAFDISPDPFTKDPRHCDACIEELRVIEERIHVISADLPDGVWCPYTAQVRNGKWTLVHL